MFTATSISAHLATTFSCSLLRSCSAVWYSASLCASLEAPQPISASPGRRPGERRRRGRLRFYREVGQEATTAATAAASVAAACRGEVEVEKETACRRDCSACVLSARVEWELRSVQHSPAAVAQPPKLDLPETGEISRLPRSFRF